MLLQQLTAKENVLLIWGWKVAFSYSSGEEEDPWGGDPLSTGGLRAVGLLRCPRQGHCSFFSFHIIIRPSSYLCHWAPYWFTPLYHHVWKRNVMWQRSHQCSRTFYEAMIFDLWSSECFLNVESFKHSFQVIFRLSFGPGLSSTHTSGSLIHMLIMALPHKWLM